ncbi:hypothetical protein LSH36_81g02040 [Paralvinella palmiformis]|uniref:E3 ubiquitin-protein ligase Hakai n=1 Tax=Paralvinella palmiformis TaxID=53620 RepID=A0AAD9K2J6_9ANNE|nr:hypothetical protein LSH36_81g02040 [Paralvinella palmiformis]
MVCVLLDLELEGNDTTRSKSSQGVRKNISIKLKNGDGATKSRGRSKRSTRSSSRSAAKPKKESPVVEKTDDDIIEGMEFTTMKVSGAEPMHKMQKLKWDHKVNLLGIKVIDPIIHTCETCNLPILIYGRMIPCKHVFCLDCAKKSEKVCSRCEDPVNRVEQSALGAVFVCNFGGSKHGVSGCRRTYLSQRDLQAHINYRHLKQQSDQQTKQTPVTQAPAPVQSGSASTSSLTVPPSIQTGNYGLTHSPALMSPTVPIVQQPAAQASSLMHPQHDQSMLYPPPVRTDGIGHGLSNLQPPTNPQIHQSLNPPISQAAPNPGPMPSQPVHMAPPPVSTPVDTYQNIPVMATRTSNLITVPIQDESDYTRHDASQYPTSSAAGQYMPPSLAQPMLSNAPPSHFSAVSHQSQMPGYSSGNHQPPQGLPAVSHPQPPTMISSCPPIINAPLNIPGVNLSQPPPNTPMGMPPQARPSSGGPPAPMMGNRYPNPGGQAMFNQPPPTNARTWPGAPPPQTGHMGGPPVQMVSAPRAPNSSANMGPLQSRPFYH